MGRHFKTNNIRLVSERAGVSVATVSRVVNNRTDVSEKLREKILAVIQEMNFSPNKSVCKIFNIGVAIFQENPLLDEYLSGIVTGMATYTLKNPVELSILFNAGEQKTDFLKQIRARRCDAVCLLNATPERIAVLEKAKIPTMLINDSARSEHVGFITNDAYGAGRLAAEHLIGLGHQKIAFLNIDSRGNHEPRRQGYLDALKTAGIVLPETFQIEHIPTTYGQEAGYLQAMELFRREPGVTAILAVNDLLAYGVYKACWETGRRIPADISVVGFDDLPNSRYLTPPLTTAAQPITDIGFKAVNYLFLFLQKKISSLPGEKLPTELILRNSTATPP